MDSLEIIAEFKNSISWADDCETFDLTHIYKDFHVMRHEDFWFIPLEYSPSALSIDCPMLARCLAVHLKEQLQIDYEPSICVIWGGDIDIAAIERISNVFMGTGVTPFWSGAKANLSFARWLARISDGVDWARTFQSFDPENPQLIMEWDKPCS